MLNWIYNDFNRHKKIVHTIELFSSKNSKFKIQLSIPKLHKLSNRQKFLQITHAYIIYDTSRHIMRRLVHRSTMKRTNNKAVVFSLWNSRILNFGLLFEWHRYRLWFSPNRIFSIGIFDLTVFWLIFISCTNSFSVQVLYWGGLTKDRLIFI